MIINQNGARPLRKVVVATIAALSLAAAIDGIQPAQALPLAAAIAPQASDVATPGIEHAAYYYPGYYHRRFYRPYYRYRPYRGYRRAIPCRGDLNSHLSKRYC